MDLSALAQVLRRITVELRGAGGGIGSGVVWGPEWIVTNAHVARHPRVALRLADGRRREAVVAARDVTADLAALHVPDLDGVAPTLAGGEALRVGALLVALGHPFGVSGALTAGVVHAIGPITPNGRPWIQADLRLAPGNSGGPLADSRGRLLGLNTMIAGGLALAIPVSAVQGFMRGVAGPPA
jgi:serine protease Do